MEYLQHASERKQCTSRLLTAARILFEVCTVIINLADVTTDIIVAVQFFRDGDTVWAWLVVTSLVIANLVYTVLGGEFVIKEITGSDIGRPVAYTVSFFIGQLLPFLNVLSHSVRGCKSYCQRLRASDADDEVAYNALDDVDTCPPATITSAAALVTPNATSTTAHSEHTRFGISTAAQEELNRIATSTLVQESIRAAMSKHFEKYALFYVESIVEAAPQAVIQLIAITFLGRASTAQMVSLCCSLFSITSKAVVLSQAYDVRVMVFKFMLAAHDVFSAFYLFSTLLAIETVKQTTFFGLDVSWLSYIWLWKFIAQIGFAALSGLGLAIYMFVFESRRAKDRCACIAAVLAAVVVVVPVALALEVVKLFWMGIGLQYIDPGQNRWTVFAAMTNFTFSDGKTRPKLRHLLLQATLPTPNSIPRRHSDLSAVLRRLDANPTLAAYLRDGRDFSLSGLRARIKGVVHERCSPLGHLKDHPVLSKIWTALAIFILLSGQLFSFAYPFINAAFQFHTHNILQATCFYAACFALLIAIVLSPFAWWTWAFTYYTRGCYSYSAIYSIRDAAKWIEDYYTPRPVAVLQGAISTAVLPNNVTAECAAFLRPADIGMNALSIAEADALQKQVRDQGNMYVEPVGNRPAPNIAAALLDVRSDDTNGGGDDGKE
jgi:hypothetical protein